MPSVFKYNGNEIIDSSGKVTSAGMPEGSVLQVVNTTANDELGYATGKTPYIFAPLTTQITIKNDNPKILVQFNFGTISFRSHSSLGYAKVQFKIGSGSYADVEPLGLSGPTLNQKHHMSVNYPSSNYHGDNGATMTVCHTPTASSGSVLTYACLGWGESTSSVWYINRTERNLTADFSSTSSCTIFEIAT